MSSPTKLILFAGVLLLVGGLGWLLGAMVGPIGAGPHDAPVPPSMAPTMNMNH
jgi:hypothetical protein